MESLPAASSAGAPGHRFGKYSLVARLASGGMAEIFLARLQGVAGFEKLVCIKRILPHLARDPKLVAMFLDEARTVARISHPNVCQVFELGEIEGSYYLAMEYLEGVPLACFRRHDHDGPAPDPRLVAGVAIQACEGLHHAHQLKNTDGSVMEIVHRDVSPQNLFVTPDGIVKVLDFGIAKIQDATVRTSTGMLKGTFAYMAPEQLRGERVDRRTDVFAMGIVIWETLTRRHLFKRDTEFLTFEAITTDPIEDVRAIRPDVPPAMSQVIMTALARDRGGRFPTARALGEAVAAAIQPFSAAMISDELVRAFPGELAAQAALIRIAREGGVLDLDVERGPSVGPGIELLTTPISQQHARPELSVPEPSVPEPSVRTISAQPPPVRGVAPVVAAPVPVIAAPVPVIAAPVAMPIRRSWRPLAIAALVGAVCGAGAFIYARVVREPARVVSEAPARAKLVEIEQPDAAVSAEAASAGPSVAAPAARSTAAPPIVAPQNAALRPPEPVPAASATAARTTAAQPGAATPVRPAGRPVKSTAPAAVKPSDQPGFITIDSSPVYAVIFIDGQPYGETPLVRRALLPGRHDVRAVAPSGAIRHETITIESGKVAPTKRITW